IRQLDEGFLPFASQAAFFGKTRAEDLYVPDAVVDARLQCRLRSGGGHDDQSLVHRLGNVGQAGIGAQPVDRIHLGIDRVDSAFVSGFGEEAQEAAAELVRVGGGPDDGDRSWIKKTLEGMFRHAHERAPVRKVSRLRWWLSSSP